MEVNLKAFIWAVIFIVFIIIILLFKDINGAYLAIGFITSMIILLGAVEKLIPGDSDKNRYVNLSDMKDKFTTGLKNTFTSKKKFKHDSSNEINLHNIDFESSKSGESNCSSGKCYSNKAKFTNKVENGKDE